MTRISLDQVETSERFYRIPKVFTEETSYYSLMSLEAKFAYGLLKDRFELSIKNKWIDKNGFVYLNFTVESLANDYLVNNINGVMLSDMGSTGTQNNFNETESSEE